MIQLGDLRIGNWFIGYDNKPFQWSYEHFALLGREVDYVEIDELIKGGVPLTEEIMKHVRRIEDDRRKTIEFRCEPPGERQIENNYRSFWLNPRTCESRLLLSPSYRRKEKTIPDFWFCWYSGNNGWFLPIQEIDQLKYVHQLQNLYWALINKELEVKL